MGVYDSELNNRVMGQPLPPWDSQQPFFYHGNLNGYFSQSPNFWNLAPSIVSDTAWTLNTPGRHHWLVGSDIVYSDTNPREVLLPRMLGAYVIFIRPLADSQMAISHKADCILGGVSIRYHYPIILNWNQSTNQDMWGYEHRQLRNYVNRGYLTNGTNNLYDSGDTFIRGFRGSSVTDYASPSTHSLIVHCDCPIYIRMVLFFRSYMGQIDNGVFSSGDGTW